VIEIDGGHHYSSLGTDDDVKRDAYLKDRGLKVLRFNNYEVLTNIDGVGETIYNELNGSNPP
jgi:very-short-patch-repair endonuclease